MGATQMMPVTHVSLSDALASPMGQKVVRLRPDDLPSNISIVRVPGIGKIPAVVALRTSLDAAVVQHGIPPIFQWKLIVSPHEERLLRRLFGRVKGDLGEGGVSYEMIPRLRLAHNELSLLQPPQGSFLQVTFAFDMQGQPVLEWFASSLESARRERLEAERQNALTIEKAWPFGWFIKWRKIGLVDVPEVPEHDTWLAENESELTRIVNQHFATIMESLWRSVFNEGDVSSQLKADGYQLERIGHTRIGVQSLGTIVRDRRGRLTHLTQLRMS